MRHLKTIIVTSFVASLCSCFYTDKEINNHVSGFSRLKVAIDTNANFYFDSIRLSAPFKFIESNYRYDTTINNMVYIFDSVENGDITLTLSSFLDRTFDKRVLLRHDTTVFIGRNELNNFINADSKALPSLRLEDGDSLVIGFWSMGCFHFLKENVIISKEHEQYVVRFNTARGKAYGFPTMNFHRDFDLTFETNIDMFYEDCKKLFHHEVHCFSTTSTLIYIRKGNLVFPLPDIGCDNWGGYEKLIKAIYPPWPKVKNDS